MKLELDVFLNYCETNAFHILFSLFGHPHLHFSWHSCRFDFVFLFLLRLRLSPVFIYFHLLIEVTFPIHP